jgi:sodium/bile acid cotransporter 7
MSSEVGQFLARRWFLLALVLGGLLAAFWPASLDWTRYTPPRWVMPFTLFLSAVTLEGRRLLESLRSPWAALWAVALGYSLPPLLGWAFGFILIDDYRLGLLVCSAAPCTLASAVIWTRLAGGNDAVALLATFASTGVSWLITTGWLALTTGHEFALGYASIMRDLALILVLPVALGQSVRAVPALARLATRRKPLLNVLARLLVLLVLIRSLHDLARFLRDAPGSIGTIELLAAFVACLAVHLISLLAGWQGGGWIGFDRETRIAIAFAASQKSLPVSLVLLDLIFPDRPLAVVPLLVYHAGQLTVDTIIAERWVATKRDRAG